MQSKKKAVGYIRVSTDAQAQEQKFGVEAQRVAIEKYAEENGYQIVQWLTDIISGVADERPQWDKIIAGDDVINPPFEAVIVFKSDRVARDIKLYFYYLYKLEQKGVNLVSVEETFDGELGNVYRALIIFCAEQERKNIALRTSRGRKIKACAGGFSGGRPPYGYKVLNHQLVIDEKEAEVVKTIFELDRQAIPFEKIARILNESGYRIRKGSMWTSAHIWYIVRNKRIYQGYYRYGTKEWVKGVHEPILSANIAK